MTASASNTQDEPLDPENYKHQLLLLKSAHYCRPVLYRGLHQFINSLTLFQDGGRVGMDVYLMGITGSIDSREIQIKRDPPSEGCNG